MELAAVPLVQQTMKEHGCGPGDPMTLACMAEDVDRCRAIVAGIDAELPKDVADCLWEAVRAAQAAQVTRV